MAITKYKVIKKNLEAVINYAKNGEKTENGILVSAINCLPETAYTQMMLTKKNFHKEGGRLGYHIIQSFEGKEISPEKCNKIGVELAKELWGDKYQVIVCTHTNKNNVHNHIVLNSVSFIDGTKYHNSNVEIALLRETNDDICRKYGLSVVESKKANKEKDIARSRISNYNQNSGKMEIIRTEIDNAIENSRSYKEFKELLQNKGYYIKDTGKYFTITSPYYNRNIRLARAFGNDYTCENIKSRIYEGELYYKLRDNTNDKVYTFRIYDKVKIDPLKLKTSSFYRLYVHYLYLLGKLPAKIHYEYRTKEYYKEIEKLDKTSEEIRLIVKYDLQSIKDTQELKTKLFEEIAPLKSERENLWIKYNKNTNKLDKNNIKDKIDKITENINTLNEKIQTCKRIISNSEKGEKEQGVIGQRIKENQLENEKENNKNKDLKRVR